ncbi:unnamed protein product [Candidula unifasciata]|uniref:Polysaccharide pyruvyl transferase domain-containing protein n=1 Tax=Candidula unifasciata TaxID=100452 RepID=A0A8S3ZXF1_9EUPU|nr:unnamed protein product [Candidula unifasciata]
MNVVSHSIANIFKRLLVVLLLSALGTRELSVSNYLGLGIALAGLLIHTHGKVVADCFCLLTENVRREGHKRSTFTALVFLALFASAVVTLSGMLTSTTGRLPAAGQLADTAFSSENYGLRNVRDALTEESHLVEAESDPDLREFLSWRLVDHPEETDKRSKTLTTSREIIEEAQRILANLLGDLIGTANHVMLIDVPVFENKGDPAIAAGGVMLMKRLGKTIVYYCETYSCQNNTRLREALRASRSYRKDDLVILMNGGGNLVGYPLMDGIRTKFINTFHDKKSIILTQSIWLHGNYSANLDFARSVYSNRPNLTILIRDRQSLEIAKNNFKGVKLILAPDMAFCIGMTPRQMPPLYDIVWLKRNDSEGTNYTLPNVPTNISVEISDWYSWKSNKGPNDIETAFHFAGEGFQFLQRGRVVITDRLHGHILCLLMDIPHLSSFHRTWTQGLENTVLVSNGSLALESGLELLTRYEKWLPLIGSSYKPTGG